MIFPQISIIIPTYNRQATIQACIESVLAQTQQDFEIIVVDDGSTDKTVEHVRAFKDLRILLIILPENRGAQAARNVGIQAARGEWVAFLDSDDQFLMDSLEARLEVAQKQGVFVVHSDCWVKDKNRKEKRLFGIPALQGNAYPHLLRRPGPMYQALLVKRDCLLRIGQLDESIVAYQEWDTMIRLAKDHAFGFVTRPTYIYNRTGNDMISGNLRKAAEGYMQIVAKHETEIVRLCGRNAMAMHYLRAARFKLSTGDRGLAWQDYRTAWKWSRTNWRVWAYFPVILLGKRFQDKLFGFLGKG